MEQAHFGGGMFKKKADSTGETEEPKSKKDIMLDIIAKAKTAKVCISFQCSLFITSLQTMEFATNKFIDLKAKLLLLGVMLFLSSEGRNA